ncbi:hypothetical protein [Streptomyces sp. NRRL F-5053]|uniref:hypothetical protein n=1 Tax=Streptomyces sp. NRRL F-5053 TaxID=1463854 RepID=UPI00133158CA|nr:hypothetical protein [Streptomyces sp. NRRL F-5053]
MTGAELEARFGRWRHERQTQRAERASEDTARARRRSVCLATSACALALVVVFGITGNSFTSQRADNERRIASLDGQVTNATAVFGDTGAAEKLTALSETAAADAKKVATAQQAFADLHRRMSVESDPGNGAPNRAATDIAKHRRTLAPFFDEGSYVAREKDAYTWQNITPFDEAGKIDPRFAWYVRYDGSQAAKADTYAWTVEAVTPDLDTGDKTGVTNKATVVWLCRETTSDEVLAWAKAGYAYHETDDSGVFEDLDLVITTAGAQHQYPSVKKPRGGAGAEDRKNKQKDEKR